MLFSIITVCYNAEAKIESTIKSVISQTCKDFEYIIIDGNSTDSTREIIKNYLSEDNIYLYSENDFGIYNAMNRGICRANGDYIYFLNAGDCFYDINVLNNIAGYINEYDKVYYGKVHYTNGSEINSFSEIATNMSEFGDKVRMEWMPCHQGIFAPRQIMTRYYFNEQYVIRADFDWLVKSYLDGVIFQGIDAVVADFDMEGISSDLSYREQFNNETTQIMTSLYRTQSSDELLIEKLRVVTKERDTITNKYLRIMQMVEKWVKLTETKSDISKYLKNSKYSKVAVYGAGIIGKHMMNVLEESGVDIAVCIDKNAENIVLECPVVTPEKLDIPIDIIVVTATVPKQEVVKIIPQEYKNSIITIDELMQKCVDSSM